MTNPLAWLLDSSPYVPRGSCGDWPPAMDGVWIAANAMIALAYFLIPAWLWIFRRESRGGLDDAGLTVQFIAFIWLCGLTHVTEVLVFAWPAYRLFATIYLATGIVSIRTAILLGPAVRAFLKRPTRDAYHDALDKINNEALAKQLAYEELVEFNHELSTKLDRLESEIANRVWREDNGAVLRGLLAEMRGVASRHGNGNGHGNGGQAHAL